MAQVGPREKIYAESHSFLDNAAYPAYHYTGDRAAVTKRGVNSQAMSASSELEPSPSRSGARRVEKVIQGPVQGVGWGGFTAG